MGSLFKRNKNNEKGEKILAFFTFQKIFFSFSVVLLIIAISSAYTLSIKDKAAQANTQQSLENFEKTLLQEETPVLENTTKAPKYQYDIDRSNSLRVNEEGINSNKIQQITYLPKDKPKIAHEIAHESIAKLYVEKIDLEIAVLSKWSYELLEVSVNKFGGPEPNESGNFIVIGHNYSNGEHFGNLDLIEIGDLIELTDLSGRKITYEVYEMLIIKPNEVEKLKTVDIRTLTLITCDVNRNLRLVVKSREIN